MFGLGCYESESSITLPESDTTELTLASEPCEGELKSKFEAAEVTFQESPSLFFSGQDRSRKSYASTKSYRRFSAAPNAAHEEHHVEPAGLEPGVDLKTTTVHLDNSVGSEISIIDYSEYQIEFNSFDVSVTETPHESSLLVDRLVSRPRWAKVRWIAINGISWEAIEPVAKFYDLHPLSLEDLLDIPQKPKVEVFPHHIFCCLPLHIMISHDYPATYWRRIWNNIKSLFLGRLSGCATSFASQTTKPSPAERTTRGLDEGCESLESQDRSQVRQALDATPPRSLYLWDRCDTFGDYYRSQVLKKTPLSYQLKTVAIEQVSIFMNENTVITVCERSGHRILDPIFNRVLSHSTMIRRSTDPTTLVQAIIDTCVDHLQPIISEYRARIYRLQVEAVLHPTMRLTRALHLIKTDLTVLMNTVSPITSLVNAFKSRTWDHKEQNRNKGEARVMSSSEITNYFNDIVDHAQSYNEDLKQMIRHSDSMSTLIYNTISIQSSDAVKLLSLVTVVFLPLTFLSGYFGMNFTDFDSLNNGLGYYWSLAAPCSAGLILFLMYDTLLDSMLRVRRWFQNTSID